MAEQRMEKQRGRDRSLTLVDVYDIAADIGKEFENIIDEEGADRVTSLMQKVIAALEQLEILVQKNDTEQMLIEDLRRTIEHLEHEDNKKNDERIRYARDIEQVEEHFKSETKDYLTTIKRLQDENRKLSSSLTAATERDSAFSEDESFIEIDIVNKLQGILEKQREQIRSMENNLAELKSEMEEMKSMNDKLSGSNKDLRRKLRQAQSQLNCLVDERAELQVTLQDQQRETGALIKRLGLANKENEDLARSGGQEPDLRNKIIFDLEDPKRPRFTLAELKDILQERNSLKARVSDLEDELEMYRPGTRDSDIDSDGSDLPVQGPLPFEPEDAPWKKGETSGIRKLFAYVTGRVVKVSQNLANAGQELGIQPI
ncbi:RILP-like protein homolog isoform X2 [Eurytemora carolleeae]|uniref:RILP-like protein homolog isoform X2 n=1 Tax=Eurytemora carolleeae TaxID=1294199 RepID=UPI000C777FA2|nr:RILP-like protein homolog isoform X2 [Eurytemora carolleeae]|eukprot:XP_023336508.1 RILP-like protein homolog isoform X2 [Eurytemora affinis]